MGKTLGQVLREHRIRKGQTQESAAHAIGCDVGTLGRWERHRMRVLSHRESLRAWLGCDPETFEELLLRQAEAVAARHAREQTPPGAGMSAAPLSRTDLDRAAVLRTMWNAREMLVARRTVCRLAESGRVGIGGAQSEILGFFEQLDLFLEHGEISLEYVWLTYGCYVDLYWWVLEEAIRHYQARFDDSSWYAGMVALKRKMDRFTRERGARIPDGERLRILLAEELEYTALFVRAP